MGQQLIEAKKMTVEITDDLQNEVVDEVVEEQSQDDSSEEAAFLDVFNEDKTTTVTIDDTTQTESETKQAAETEQEVDDPIVFGEYTASQLTDIISKVSEFDNVKKSLSELQDRTYGTLGNHQQQLKNLVEQYANRGASFNGITAEKLQHLNDYDPELAEIIASDLGAFNNASSVNEETISNLTRQNDERMKTYALNMESRLVNYFHPDVTSILNSNDWGNWVNEQDYQTQSLIRESNDGFTLAKQLDNFKNWRNEQNKQKQQKNKRLEAAVRPTDRGSTAQPTSKNSELEAFLKVFNQ